MGWRARWMTALGKEEAAGLTYGALVRLAAALTAMPVPDRIALARELLAGTGRAVVVPVGKDEAQETWDDYRRGERDGWNACRAIMLGDEG